MITVITCDKEGCEDCDGVKILLESGNLEYKEMVLDTDDKKQLFKETLGSAVVPQVYLGDGTRCEGYMAFRQYIERELLTLQIRRLQNQQ